MGLADSFAGNARCVEDLARGLSFKIVGAFFLDQRSLGILNRRHQRVSGSLCFAASPSDLAQKELVLQLIGSVVGISTRPDLYLAVSTLQGRYYTMRERRMSRHVDTCSSPERAIQSPFESQHLHRVLNSCEKSSLRTAPNMRISKSRICLGRIHESPAIAPREPERQSFR
jgi:hypothetical protein